MSFGINLTMANWQKKSKRKIILEVLEILVPVVFCVILIVLIMSMMKKPKDKKTKQIDRFITNRIFSSSDELPDFFNNSLTKESYLKPIIINYPDYWIDFLDKQFGGMTLTIQPNQISNHGLHVQCSEISDDADTRKEGEDFLNRINLSSKKHSKTTILSTKADIFTVNYLSKSHVPMRAKFIFFKNNGYLIRIIMFSPENTFDYREIFFKTIIETIRFS